MSAVSASRTESASSVPSVSSGAAAASGFQRPPLARRWIADHLMRRITDGTLPPGRRVRQEEVAAEFGTSQGPVREAFRTIAAEGLLVHETNCGYRVASIVADDVEGVRVVRELLESAALRLAVPRLNARDVTEIRRNYEHMNELAAAGGAEFSAAHEHFHLAVFDRAESPRLVAMLRRQWRQAQRMRAVVLDDPADRRATAHDQHRALLDAFIARDADAAVDAMTKHRDDAAAAVLASLAASAS